MNILVIGSGGREHALCYGLHNSPSVKNIFCATGNAGIAKYAECIAISSQTEIIDFTKNNEIDLVVIGPEQPLVDGLSDALRAENINVFGCSRAAAELEGSKGFTKDLCAKYNIPTGAYGRFKNAGDAHDYLKTQTIPIVIKADGLAAGKGVVIAGSMAEATQTIDEMFGGKFGKASDEIVIEEFLEGEEISFFALSDGETAVEFGSAQDHKRAYDGDKGPNTGGMGAYSPAPIMTQKLKNEIMQNIILPTVAAMKAENTPFSGVLFAGLMITKTGPQLIEYNVRFGDPEAQVLMALLDEDLGKILYAVAKGQLPDKHIKFKDKSAICVVMASNGYPASYEKNTEIKNLTAVEGLDDIIVFHAGTKLDGNKLLAIGGRVLGITAIGDDIKQAKAKAYAAIDKIDWAEGFYRKDIAWRAT